MKDNFSGRFLSFKLIAAEPYFNIQKKSTVLRIIHRFVQLCDLKKLCLTEDPFFLNLYVQDYARKFNCNLTILSQKI